MRRCPCRKGYDAASTAQWSATPLRGSGRFVRPTTGKGARMRRFSTSLIFVVLASGVEACPSFGFKSPHLSQYFCRQLDAFTGPSTRGLSDEPLLPQTQSDLAQPKAEWLALPAVERAWRSDPAKTLKLINRIRDAGGRAAK